MLRILATTLMLVAVFAPVARSEDAESALKGEIEALEKRLAALEKREHGGGEHASLDVSAAILGAVGTSSEENDVLGELQGGGHDPNERGFNLQQVEVVLAGRAGPHADGEIHVVLTDEDIELEEAFVATDALPGGAELLGGYYLSRVGLINPAHPHAWSWVDQPVILSRLLGGEGIRGVGALLSFEAPLPWHNHIHLGAQNSDDDTMVSFLGEGGHHDDEEGEEEEEAFEETAAGRPRVDRDVEEFDDLLFHARWANHFQLHESVGAALGISGMSGPNASGDDARTWIYGADVTLSWYDGDDDRPAVSWQTEILKRDFEADTFAGEDAEGEPLIFGSETIEDWGLYSQVLVRFLPRWEAGLRFEYATGDDDEAEDRDGDFERADRVRLSPLLAWRCMDDARVRLQYNFDDSDVLEDGDAHTVWVGVDVLLGGGHTRGHAH